MSEKDEGLHYRITFLGVQIDPARIAREYGKKYGPMSAMLFTVLKKLLVCGDRGHKNYLQDLKDMRNAIDREIEMVEEDQKNVAITNIINEDKDKKAEALMVDQGMAPAPFNVSDAINREIEKEEYERPTLDLRNPLKAPNAYKT